MQIGDVSQRSGISVRMLRYYDRIGLVTASERTAAGYREYAQADLRRLFEVEALRTLGLSLAQVDSALDDHGIDAGDTLSRLVSDTELRIAAEQELLARLRGIEASAPQGWDDVLDVIGLINGLRSDVVSERQAAVLRWGATPSPVLGPLVDAYLAEPDPNAAGTLRWAIAQAEDDAVPVLAGCATADDWQVRSRAVEALAGISGPEASAALAGFVNDTEIVISARVVLALASRALREPTQPGLDTDELCSRLVESIAEGIDDVHAAEVLGALAETSPEVGARVISLIGSRIAKAAAEPDPTELLYEEPTTQERLVQALGELPAELVAPLLSELAGDPDESVSRIARYLIVLQRRRQQQ